MTTASWEPIILARCCNAGVRAWLCLSLLGVPLRGADPLSLMVSAARAPSAPQAARVRLADYARDHAKTTDGALAQLALGLVQYEHEDYAGAVRDLTGLAPRLPKLADYIVFYLGSAQSQLEDNAGAAATLSHGNWTQPLSPLRNRAVLLRADALTKANKAGEAAELLLASKDLPQPDGSLALASAYEARGENIQAAAFYQRVFFAYPATPAAATAGTALDRLKPVLGKNFPKPSAQQLIERPSRWLDVRQYAKAKADFQSALPQLTGVDRETAQVRLALTDLRSGNALLASRTLKALRLPLSAEVSAERNEYLVECGRKLGNEAMVADALHDLEKHNPKSPWRLKALLHAANKHLVEHQTERYLPLYRAAFENFPADNSTALTHWRVAWEAYITRRADADRLMREQVAKYPTDTKASAAMYFLARLAEERKDPGAARVLYERTSQAFPHYYYGMLARTRLAPKTISTATPSPEMTAWLGAITFPQQSRFVETPDAVTSSRIERAKLLRTAGYNDYAESELRFAAKNGAEPHLIAMELASAAPTTAESLRAMKSTVSDYLTMPLDAAPIRFWQLLFPLPFRPALEEFAKKHNLDPFMVAGLIRQESEFNPTVRSRANAYGLTQILPSTGRQLARMNGFKTFTLSLLLEPETNIQLGTSYMRMLLDEWGGKWEETLASYNAGKGRVVNWVTWGQFREPAEFVESIPFTETHEYVQAVMRNAAIYREIYVK